MFCDVTSCVTARKRDCTLWPYQGTKLTHYASVTAHKGLELNLAIRTLSRLRRLFIANLLQHNSFTQRGTVKYLCIKLLKCLCCSGTYLLSVRSSFSPACINIGQHAPCSRKWPKIRRFLVEMASNTCLHGV